MIFFSPLLTVLIVRFIYIIVKSADDACKNYRPTKKWRYKMNFSFKRKIQNVSMLFNGHYVDVKSFYVLTTGKVPCICFVGEIDVTKAFAYIKNSLGADVKNTFQHSYYNHDSKEIFFNNSIFVITNDRMIELANNYCHVLHDGTNYAWARNMVTALADFRLVQEQVKVQTQVLGFRREEISQN